MNNLKLFRLLVKLMETARKSEMSPSDIAGCFFFALELLGEVESGHGPGYIVALGWLETQRSAWLARLEPQKASHLN